MLLPMHGIGGRGDLPVPLWLAVYAAGAAVAVSFFAAAAFWARPRFEGRQGGVVVPAAGLVDARATRWLLKATGLAGLGILLGAAWFGSPDPAANPAPTWLYVWVWVGIIPVSILCGPVWPLVNPVRTLADGVRRILRRPHQELPERWRYWPAVIGLTAFLWLELASPVSSDPRAVATFVTAYTIGNLAGGVVFGPTWFRHGDGFQVYAELLARFSPWSRDDQRRLVLRNPLANLTRVPQAPGIVALLCLLLGSTGFDGISRWSAWTVATGNLGATGRTLAHTAGLVAAVAVVTGLFVFAARATGVPARQDAVGAAGLPGVFAHSLVPIVIGYAVAHYFSFAVFQGQAGVLLGSDPFDRGWDLFGTSGAAIDYAVVGTAAIAGVQIGAIVLGHVVAVLAAHDRATAMYRRRQLRRAQYPMLAAMVAFTAGGIALVAGS